MNDRIAALDWPALAASLWARGWATTGPLLSPAECAALRESYDDNARFRARVVMARHRFGEGEYKYFGRPVPPLVSTLREASYERLAPIAREWNRALGADATFPDSHADFISRCSENGQARPTPLLLRYTTGGYNCLHQDLYGQVHFPLQMVVMLSRPADDYGGGHFLLVENRPRAQSAGEALLPGQGEAVIFTTRTRPVRGARGFYRATVRHGVSTVTAGERFTLGIVYHDAE
ncbi:MAG: 2OG-Fe(II) oxygenase [Acidobacteriota bacterium]|nr:2OG-Fe(II) oxygenase [Acidobacteriota bacterium]